MFDHIGIATRDLAASERFYRTVLAELGSEPVHVSADLVEWQDWDIGPTDDDHRLTKGLHVGFRAPSREAVDAFWQAGVDGGYVDGGAPGLRTTDGQEAYGSALLDPDGNCAEAVWSADEREVDGGRVVLLRLRVADLAATTRFYATIAPFSGLTLAAETPAYARFDDGHLSLALVADQDSPTVPLHFAFPSADDAAVQAFHAAATAAGYTDNGGPGERAIYHPGYYGAFVLDPAGHNVELVNHHE